LVIGDLLPPSVVTAEALGDSANAVLLPEEEPLVAEAVEKRRREFAATRACARQALAALGLPPQPLLSGPRREPLWPDGIVGSLTHCSGYRAAAVARRSDFASLGIDAEPDEVLAVDVAAQVALPVERDALRRLPDDVCWARVVFSAKESIYKAWYPLARRWLGFEDALVHLCPDSGGDPSAGGFIGRLLVPGPLVGGKPLTSLSGRYLVRHRLILTAVTVPHRS
jgi:4'-phosphopantetheinyl transferase EntD